MISVPVDGDLLGFYSAPKIAALRAVSRQRLQFLQQKGPLLPRSGHRRPIRRPTDQLVRAQFHKGHGSAADGPALCAGVLDSIPPPEKAR